MTATLALPHFMSNHTTTIEVMSAVPAPIRTQIVSGMRWTLWLSAVAVPFSYGITILLARCGPEVIATYGLLLVYIGIVSAAFYLGGDSVLIRFIPTLARPQRLSFVASYCIVVFSFAAVAVAVVTVHPPILRYLFGRNVAVRFYLTMLYLCPFYLLFALVAATHKALLDLCWAQLMARIVTIGSFAIYGTIYLAHRSILVTHYTVLIWGVYCGLTLLATAIGFGHLLRSDEWRGSLHSVRLFLPDTFWSYTLSTQGVSVVSFLMQRLDLILVLQYGSLTSLGKYLVILTIAETVRTGNRFFLDSLLPSLTNTLILPDRASASQVLSMNVRLLYVVNIVGLSAIFAFLPSLLALFGTQYLQLQGLIITETLFFGLAVPGMAASTLLSSVGRQQVVAVIYSAQLVAFIAMFSLFWHRWALMGAVLATGAAALLASFSLLAVAKRVTGIVFTRGRDYVAFIIASTALAVLIQYPRPLTLTSRVAACVLATALFFSLAHYSLAEISGLITCYLPTWATRAVPRSAMNGRA